MIKKTKSEGEILMFFANGHKRGLIKGKDVQFGSIRPPYDIVLYMKRVSQEFTVFIKQ